MGKQQGLPRRRLASIAVTLGESDNLGWCNSGLLSLAARQESSSPQKR